MSKLRYIVLKPAGRMRPKRALQNLLIRVYDAFDKGACDAE